MNDDNYQIKTKASIEKGNILRLRVSKNQHNGFYKFLPDFEDCDEMISDFSNSIRFFAPVEHGACHSADATLKLLRPKEIYKVEVLGWNIHPTMMSKDGRRYIFVQVKILEREERTEVEIDYETGIVHVDIFCGNYLQKSFTAQAEIKNGKFCKNHGHIYKISHAMYGEKIIGIKVNYYGSRSCDDFIRDLVKVFKDKARAQKFFDSIPELSNLTPDIKIWPPG